MFLSNLQRINRKMKKRNQRRKTYKRQRRNQRSRRVHRGGALSNILPTTTWGEWNSLPGSTAWSPSSSAPPPLANGGLYTGAQSTGEWASRPFPATQYAMAAEAARVSGLTDVFYHQRPTTNVGASWSPYVGQSISPQHWSARMPSL